MGINIHMHIIRDQKFIEKDILNGYSNPKWFDELQLNSCNRDYEKFPVKSGIPKVVPEQIINDYSNGNNYYRFYYITIKDFLDWCDKVNPWLKAGWATTYQKWQYEDKGVTFNDDELPIEKPTGGSPDDYYFITYFDQDDIVLKLYDKMARGMSRDFKKDDILLYYFS